VGRNTLLPGVSPTGTPESADTARGQPGRLSLFALGKPEAWGEGNTLAGRRCSCGIIAGRPPAEEPPAAARFKQRLIPLFDPKEAPNPRRETCC
jgi:hypothetical protein